MSTDYEEEGMEMERGAADWFLRDHKFSCDVTLYPGRGVCNCGAASRGTGWSRASAGLTPGTPPAPEAAHPTARLTPGIE